MEFFPDPAHRLDAFRPAAKISALPALILTTLSAIALGMLVRRQDVVPRGAGNNRLLLLKTNALHTDIAIPATPMVRGRFAFLAEANIPIDDPKLTHVLVGWGSEGFYPNNSRPHRIGLMTLFHSVIGDDSVLRFAALAEAEGPGKRVHEISDEALESLVDFVLGTLDRDGEGRLKPLDHPGIIRHDHFFEASPTFAALAGCNVWVSEALAKAGIPSGRWTPLPQTLTGSIALHRRRERR